MDFILGDLPDDLKPDVLVEKYRENWRNNCIYTYNNFMEDFSQGTSFPFFYDVGSDFEIASTISQKIEEAGYYVSRIYNSKSNTCTLRISLK